MITIMIPNQRPYQNCHAPGYSDLARRACARYTDAMNSSFIHEGSDAVAGLIPSRDPRRMRGLVWVLVGTLAVSGCATGSVRSAAGRTAQDVQVAAESALTTYEALRTVSPASAYNQGYLRVVVSAEPDAVDFTQVPDAGMTDILDRRVKTYRQVKAAAAHLRLVCEGADKTRAVQSYAAAVEALQVLSDNDITTTEFRKLAATLPAELTAWWQTRRIARLHAALACAAAELGALWEQERPTWEGYVDTAYITQYAAGLLSLRVSDFDEKELGREVDAPYRIPVKAGLFKLQKYHEAIQAADRITVKLRQASEAFDRVAVPQPPRVDPQGSNQK